MGQRNKEKLQLHTCCVSPNHLLDGNQQLMLDDARLHAGPCMPLTLVPQPRGPAVCLKSLDTTRPPGLHAGVTRRGRPSPGPTPAATAARRTRLYLLARR